MNVVRGKLEMPFDFSRVRVQRQNRARVEVVSWPDIAIPVGARIARPPVNEI